MMTIDDMLSQVAKFAGVEKPAPAVKNDVKPAAEKPAEKKSEPAPIKAPVIEISGSLKKEKVSLTEKVTLNLKISKEIAYCIEKAAEAMGINVVIAVVDCAGRLICLEAMDDSYIASIKAAQEKAFTAVALKMPTHIALKESRGGSLDGYTNGNGILMLAGGTPVKYDGKIVGAVGVSGGTKDQDMLLSEIGTVYLEKRVNMNL